jgi:hypothetical protein
VREVARRDKDARFAALVTWTDYGRDLDADLRDLRERARSGRCRATPSRRACVPKADGRGRPLGIAALEDKLEGEIVQRAVVEVRGAVCEAGFPGFLVRVPAGPRAA